MWTEGQQRFPVRKAMEEDENHDKPGRCVRKCIIRRGSWSMSSTCIPRPLNDGFLPERSEYSATNCSRTDFDWPVCLCSYHSIIGHRVLCDEPFGHEQPSQANDGNADQFSTCPNADVWCNYHKSCKSGEPFYRNHQWRACVPRYAHIGLCLDATLRITDPCVGATLPHGMVKVGMDTDSPGNVSQLFVEHCCSCS